MRRRLIRKFMARGNRGMKLGTKDRVKLARRTEGFSFALVKELMVSGAMKWAATGGEAYPIYKGLIGELHRQFEQPKAE
jgi:hypothetical protein